MGWSLKNLLKGSQSRTDSLRSVGLPDQGPTADRGVSAPGSGLSRTSPPGSLSSNSPISPASSLPIANGPVLEANIAARRHLRRSSLPAMHLGDGNNDSSLLASCGMMTNPPVFDNPLRRRGCCNHKHTQQLQEYRQEAIQRELRAKRAAVSVDDLTIGQPQ